MKRMKVFVWPYSRCSKGTISGGLVLSLEAQDRLGYPTGKPSQNRLIIETPRHADAARIGDVPIPVLQILVDTDEAGDFVARWCTARREITPLLDDHDLQEQEVDIHDPKRYYQPWLFPIHPNHPAVALFNLVKDELMKMVCTHIESAWNMFSMFQSRLADNVKRPAVVLVVASLTEYDWASLRASLEEIIAEKETGDRSGLRVEIMPGCISSGDVSDWK